MFQTKVQTVVDYSSWTQIGQVNTSLRIKTLTVEQLIR